MVGPVALVGAGEFLPAMADIDRELLATIPSRRPRVVVMPTAAWPDGDATFRRWAEMGVEHFGGLGAEVEAVLVRDRGDADDAAFVQAVGEADLVYLSGGHPEHLRTVLSGSGVWAAARSANARGAALVGCSAGAMVLGGRQIEWRRRLRRVPFLIRYPESLALVPGCAVLPHYDRLPEPIAAVMALQAPRGTVVLGVDEGTAVVGRDGAWQVRGAGRVTVWRGRHRTRYRAGDVIQLGSAEAAD
jgi:cyanophycinase